MGHMDKLQVPDIFSDISCLFVVSACDSAIGLAGSSIPDSAFSASSYSAGNEPHKARLNGPGAWKPSNALK